MRGIGVHPETGPICAILQDVIIGAATCRFAQHIVGFPNVQELIVQMGLVRDLVWMVLFRQFHKRIPNLLSTARLLHSQRVIMCANASW